MLDEASTATWRGVLNWPVPVPNVPNCRTGCCQLGAWKIEIRLYPVSATTRRLELASQTSPPGYMGATEGPANVFKKLGSLVAAASPAKAAAIPTISTIDITKRRQRIEFQELIRWLSVAVRLLPR